MARKDPESRKQYNKNYYKENVGTLKNKQKRRYNPEKVKANRAKLNQQQKEWKFRVKLEVLAHYGQQGKLECCWPGCGVNDVDVLTLDHVNNNGAEDRKSRNDSGTYARVRSAGYPEGFQTLCANHQLKKEILRRRIG